MRSVEELRKAVERGCQLLDENEPGWHHKIDLGDLDISSCCDCIVSQIKGQWGPHLVGVPLHESHTHYGFEGSEKWNAEGRMAENRELTNMWADEVLRRVAADQGEEVIRD